MWAVIDGETVANLVNAGDDGPMLVAKVYGPGASCVEVTPDDGVRIGDTWRNGVFARAEPVPAKELPADLQSLVAEVADPAARKVFEAFAGLLKLW